MPPQYGWWALTFKTEQLHMKWVLLAFAIGSRSVPGYSGSTYSMHEITSLTSASFEDQASCESAAKALAENANKQIDTQYGRVTAMCVAGGRQP